MPGGIDGSRLHAPTANPQALRNETLTPEKGRLGDLVGLEQQPAVARVSGDQGRGHVDSSAGRMALGDTALSLEQAQHHVHVSPSSPAPNPGSMTIFQTLSPADQDAVRSLQPPDPRKKPEVTLIWFACRGQGWNEIKATYIPKWIPPKPPVMGMPSLVQKLRSDRKEALAQIDAMKALRDRTVNGMLDMLINKGYQELRFTTSGSDNPTSDYDVQLYDAGGLKGDPGKVIAEFNSLFRQRYGCESGTLFDTNIYDPSFRLPREDAVENAEITASEERVAVANDNTQIVGSLAKIRKFANEATWNEFQNGLMQGEAREAAEQQLKHARALFDGYEEAIARCKQEISVKELAFSSRADSPDGKLRVMNSLYVEKLGAVQEARQKQNMALAGLGKLTKPAAAGSLQDSATPDVESQRRALEAQLDKATLECKDAMVKATLFAHEAYHSEGPMIDVVGNQQGVIRRAVHYPDRTGPIVEGGLFTDPSPVPLTRIWGFPAKLDDRPLRPAEKLGSFNEQFGDALKDIHHYGREAPESEERFAKTAVQASKYVQRLFAMAESCGVQLNEKQEAFKKLNPELKKLRDGSGELNDPLKTKLKEEAGIGDIDKLQALLLALAVNVNVKMMKEM